jgi:hypothetical protein
MSQIQDVNILNVQSLHDEAMNCAAEACMMTMIGESKKAFELNELAFKKEKEAALLLLDKLEFEPTRSVLCRSAASLAIECNHTREAEQLVALGLFGNPPDEIAEELRNLLEDINIERHLKLGNIKNTDNEFQFSMIGRSIGYGVAPSSEVISRIGNMEKLVTRTVERCKSIPFRRFGSPKKKVVNEARLFLSIPKAGSYSLSCKLGALDYHQQSIPGIPSIPSRVVDEILDGIEMVSQSDIKALEKQIPNQDYLQNFLGLVGSIAPDGKEVRMIGLTSFKGGIERNISLQKPKSEIQEFIGSLQTDVNKEKIEIIGNLKYADSKKRNKGKIKIVDTATNEEYTVCVPQSLMSDIVRPLYEKEVIVSGIKDPSSRDIELKTIREA